MRSPTPPSPRELASLGAFLADPARPEGTLTLGELHGFLFAVTSAPEMVRFPEVFEFVFGHLDDVFETSAEADLVMGWIGGLYNLINAGVLSGAPRLPEDVVFRDDPMANFDPSSPVAHWARGFTWGHDWLAESWDIELPEAMGDDLDEDLTILCWFAARERSEEYETYRQPDDPPFLLVCKRCARRFTDAMASYANIGRSIYEAHIEGEGEAPIRRDPITGRNDPCPCGSGRKYKRCCGANVH